MPKYRATHKVLRAEYLELTIEAEDEDDARAKGLEMARRFSTADYEPGDVEEDPDVVSVERADDAAELTEIEDD